MSFLIASPSFVFAAQDGDLDPADVGASCADITHDLRYRMRDTATNDDIAVLQDFLNSNGYTTVSPAGFFGTSTLKAVKKFQSANGLRQTGFVGPKTRAKIKAIDCGDVIVPPVAGAPCISINSPLANSQVALPFTVRGVFNDDRSERPTGCSMWKFFEGQAGTAKLHYKNNGSWFSLGGVKVIPVSDWMSSGPKSFSVIMDLKGGSGVDAMYSFKDGMPLEVVFQEEDPSGMGHGKAFTLPLVYKSTVTPPTTPSITVLSPNGGETYTAGQQIMVKWNSSNITYPVSIYLDKVPVGYIPSFSNVISRVTLVSSTPNDGQEQITLPNSSDWFSGQKQYAVTVSPVESSGLDVADISNNSFTINAPSSTNPPVIDGVSGPSTLNTGATGTWTVTAHDSNAGNLSYSVVWGDEGSKRAMASSTTSQTATFTHVYSTAGNYVPTFTVTNMTTNQSATTSLSVNVTATTPSLSVVLSRNTAYINQSFYTNSTHKKIASFTIQAGGSQGVHVNNFQMDFSGYNPGSIAPTGISNLGIYSNGVQLGSTIATVLTINNVPMNFNIVAGNTSVIDVYADLGSSAGSLIVPLNASGIGLVSGTTFSTQTMNGQTITVKIPTPPQIFGVSGPSSLGPNQMGTWTVSSHDNNTGTLQYAVNWGESDPNYYPQSTSVFTHAYKTVGTYTATYIVTNTATGQYTQKTFSTKISLIN